MFLQSNGTYLQVAYTYLCIHAHTANTHILSFGQIKMFNI